MARKDKIAPFEFLPTRAFSLLRKWMEGGSLTESETHELVEIQKEMPVTTFKSEFDMFRRELNSMKWLLGILGTAGLSLLTIILVHLLSQ
ncbi:MAG: hypothetical protein OXF84_03880 [Bacteroidetes bacterium]|nr:hypothetical protein [Bacteroidota bacterium]